MKIKIQLITLIIFVLTVMFVIFDNLSAQDKVQDKDAELMQKIESRVEKTSNWMAYKAFRQGDTSICSSAEIPEGCWLTVRSFVFIKALTTGDCSNIPDESAILKDLCNAVYRGDCSLVSGYKKTMCEALKSRNLAQMTEAYSDLQFPTFSRDRKRDAEFFMNLYYGFKNNSEQACDNFTTHDLLKRASCNMLFGNSSFERQLNGIIKDIFYAAKSKGSCSGSCKNLCTNINNPYIRQVCNDESIKTLDNIFGAVWH